MTPRDLGNIHTIGNSCRDALPCANMTLKLPRYFYLLMEKHLDRYFQVCSPYYQVAQCNQKTLIPISSGWQVMSEKAKRISIKTNHSYQQRSSPVASFRWSTNTARFSFNQFNRKRWGVKLVDVKHNAKDIFIVTPRWPTKAKETRSPHEVRLTLTQSRSVGIQTGHQPSTSMSRGISMSCINRIFSNS